MGHKRILVIGGTGYIGKSLVERIPKEFHVVVASRSKNENFSARKFMYLDLLNRQSVFRKVRGFDLVINLAAIIKSFNRKKFDENVRGLKNLLDAMKANKINDIIYFSTQNVLLRKKSPYSRSKLVCEEMLKNSGIKHIIIRPNYVYGLDKKNRIYLLIKMIKKFGVVPIIGSGNNKIQPVMKEDISEFVVDLLNKKIEEKIINLSGPKTVSINQIINMISEKLDKKVVVLHIPVSVSKFINILIPFDLSSFMEDISPKDSISIGKTLKDNLKHLISY